MRTNGTNTAPPERDELDGWTIEISKVWPSVYRLRASDRDGVRFCVMGRDPGELRGELDCYVAAAEPRRARAAAGR
ncbi:MAG: hypothetical protein IRZ16_05260 [Myxococcaceae bacterium]|nr:hypothetical protein [Myxococcaceae bacterium]